MADIIYFESYNKEKQLVHINVDSILDDQATILSIQRKHGETDEQLKVRIKRVKSIDRLVKQAEKMDW